MFDKLSTKAQKIFLFYKNRKTTDNSLTIFYNYNFLFNYVANETSFFDLQELEELNNAGNILIKNNIVHKHIFELFLIDLAWASSSLEGNTYTVLETQKLIQHNIPANNKTNLETIMILNHKNAIKFMLENYDNINYQAYDIRAIHYLLGNNLLFKENLGSIRENAVYIKKSNYVPLFNKTEIAPAFSKLLETLSKIKNPIEQALFALIHISYLQAFVDINKRTARIVCNLPLLKNNLLPISFIEMDFDFYINGLLAVYEHNETTLIKEVFKNAYKFSCDKYSKYLKSK